MGEVIVVTSGKGGVGKTTTAANIGTGLAAQGKKGVLMDTDIGLRNLIAGGERQGDIEKVLENVVYQQLRRMGYTVNVGQLRAGEVDFVCTKSNERVYIQVAYLIASPETEEREFGILDNIRDNYPKYVISMTPLVRRGDRRGITHLGLREFLTNGLEG